METVLRFLHTVLYGIPNYEFFAFTVKENKSPGCFPSAASIRLGNGKSKTMSELQIGDQIETGISLKKCSSL